MKKEKTPEELGHFGKSLAIVLVILTGVSCYRHPELTPSFFLLLGGSALLLLFSIFSPLSLSGFEKKWMGLSEKLGIIGSTMVMLLTFVLVMTPLALLMRLLRKDLLAMNLDKNSKSYWIPIDKQGSGSRHYLPY